MTNLLQKGDILDDSYEIVEFISKGGFGAVYRARQMSMDRDVAVKLLLPGAQPDLGALTQRFRNEVKAVRNLRHPNTVQIFDFHETGDHRLYFTMEYLEGRSLRDIIKSGEAVSPKRTANILSQVLKSLAEAHSKGIIHRDIKPANIMLVDMYGEDDYVKVLDFGIAKARHDHPAAASDEPVTRTGFLVGTVRYMAPERIAGDPAGPYSDIYSLGLVAASLLIGKPLLGSSSRLEAMQMQMGTKPMPIPDEVRAGVLGPILAGALAKMPAQRFQSAEQMLEQLDAVPTAQLSAAPIDVSGELPVWDGLDDPRAGGVEAAVGESTTIDASPIGPTPHPPANESGQPATPPALPANTPLGQAPSASGEGDAVDLTDPPTGRRPRRAETTSSQPTRKHGVNARSWGLVALLVSAAVGGAIWYVSARQQASSVRSSVVGSGVVGSGGKSDADGAEVTVEDPPPRVLVFDAGLGAAKRRTADAGDARRTAASFDAGGGDNLSERLAPVEPTHTSNPSRSGQTRPGNKPVRRSAPTQPPPKSPRAAEDDNQPDKSDDHAIPVFGAKPSRDKKPSQDDKADDQNHKGIPVF